MLRRMNCIAVHNPSQTKVTDLEQRSENSQKKADQFWLKCTSNKARTLSEQSSFSKMLAGLRSLWMTEKECMYFRPASI